MNKHEWVGFVPLVGDGNPATLLARKNLHQRENPSEPFHILHPVMASIVVRQLHKIMTWSESLREFYTKSGEESVRSSSFGTLIGGLFYRSLLHKLAGLETPHSEAKRHLVLVQEHVLLGAQTQLLGALNFSDIQLLLPDSQPKRSAVTALQNHPAVTGVTWNESTYQFLRTQGITNAQLARPELIQGHTTSEHYAAIHEQGVPIVVKTSGSGMPQKLQRVLLQALQEQKRDWSFHTPNCTHFGKNGCVMSVEFPNRAARLHDFYSSLGGKTELLITYPNEQVQAVAELVSLGCYPDIVLLPPRGDHEVHNIQFILKHFPQLLRGILIAKPQDAYSWAAEFSSQTAFIPLEGSATIFAQ